MGTPKKHKKKKQKKKQKTPNNTKKSSENKAKSWPSPRLWVDFHQTIHSATTLPNDRIHLFSAAWPAAAADFSVLQRPGRQCPGQLVAVGYGSKIPIGQRKNRPKRVVHLDSFLFDPQAVFWGANQLWSTWKIRQVPDM